MNVTQTLEVPPERQEGVKWSVKCAIHKYGGPDADARAVADVDRVDYDDVFEFEGNLLLTAGASRIASLFTATGGQALTNTSARIGVGDGTTAPNIADTDLSAAAGSTHRQFEIMQATYPQVASGVITLVAVFPTTEAVFHWQEWGIDIGTPTVSAGTTVNATLVNRKVIDLGTKPSTIAWTFTVTISFQ